MDTNAFGRLCIMLQQTGDVVDGRWFEHWRSGYTVSKYVHVVLRAVIKLHRRFWVVPDAVGDDCEDHRWKWFKGCLGALNGTYINVQVPNADKPRYRSRKGRICTNTLAACDRSTRFVYILAGWEGSAGDARVLRDAVNREYGFKVPRVDPLDALADVYDEDLVAEADDPNVPGEYIDSVEPSNAWTQMRDNLAGSMWDEVFT
ncbi:uncharacterized protein LOC121810673 [Salvia splendens]|uniref:uncharacterized protein LOC121810673 n=1 Tax=Salvia splendens TaxID=180675 RepID=UPI001C257269|nr:uncharacterized protein LOC121810673 [Salvia splendens]